MLRWASFRCNSIPTIRLTPVVPRSLPILIASSLVFNSHEITHFFSSAITFYIFHYLCIDTIFTTVLFLWFLVFFLVAFLPSTVTLFGFGEPGVEMQLGLVSIVENLSKGCEVYQKHMRTADAHKLHSI